jgi:hypothetical protein
MHLICILHLFQPLVITNAYCPLGRLQISLGVEKKKKNLWLSPRLHFPAIAILTNPLILFSIIVYFRKMLKNKTNKNWEPFLKLYKFCI